MFEKRSVSDTYLIDQAIREARSIGDLIDKFRRIDPALAEQLEGKALIASKSPWGVLIALLLGWAVQHYGLGWSEETTTLVDGLLVLGASYGMRLMTYAPITSLLGK